MKGKKFELLKDLLDDLIILSINAEMQDYEPMRVLAGDIREIAERMKTIILELEENYDKGDDN
ncbi:MAG: hypothetical protein ABIL16_04440 [candidate division WOR-3 bacterium]